MHVIKSKARHLAWNGDGTPMSTLFPERRQTTGRHNRTTSENIDLEAAQSQPPRIPLQTTHSESCAVRNTDIKPIESDGAHFAHHPARAATMPQSASSEETSSPFSSTPATSKKSTGIQETFPVTDSQQEPALRQRTFVRKMQNTVLCNKEDDSLRPIDTRTSGRSRQSKRSKEHFKLVPQLRAILWSWPNILLVFVPLGIALNFVPSLNRIVVFVLNFLAIIPLAGILSFATEETALRIGETFGGLLNASFGNATELIVSIIALTKNEILIVQTSLIGSMLSNLLLVLGMCFFFGGINRMEQMFNITVAQTAMSLLALAVGSLIIPTVFQEWSDANDAETLPKVPPLSRGVAIILLFVYGCYLFFQLKTHISMYNTPGEKVEKRPSSKIEKDSVFRGIATIGAGNAAIPGRLSQPNLLSEHDQNDESDDDDGPEESTLSLFVAVATLFVATAFIGANSYFLVENIGPLAEKISAEFIGLILLPIVGNAAEHATAVTVAIKDKMDLAIGVAVGSSIQIVLLVLPLTVILGWIIGTDPIMTLQFDGFILAILFVAVLLVNYLIGDGKSNWLEGMLLMTTYIIIAVAAWFYPAQGNVVG